VFGGILNGDVARASLNHLHVMRSCAFFTFLQQILAFNLAGQSNGSMMKTHLCCWAVILSVGLGSTTVVASAEEQRMSGTVVEYNPGSLTIENAKKERVDFHAELGNQRYTPKVGDKVIVFYEIGARGWWFTYKVQRAGKTDPGKKK
jgi:hypothetical protein